VLAAWSHPPHDAGRSTGTCSLADIHPYDVILGEDWLHHNRAILDYDSCQLLTRDGHVCVIPLRLDELPSGEEPGVKSARVMPLTHQAGGFLAGGSAPTLGADLDRQVQEAQCTDRQQDLRRKSLGARTRRTELRAVVRQVLGTITGYADKSLSEDKELVLEDIPGLHLPFPSTNPPGSATPSVLSFIELEANTNLAHMSPTVHEGVI
jgi:hypothetical protein